MSSLKYGCLDPCPKTKEYPVAASQYFQHNGFTPVYLDSSGHLTGALTATTTLWGVAIIPKAGVMQQTQVTITGFQVRQQEKINSLLC
ncbi:MAG: hypothetical protein IPH11_12755 [Ignavibacteriales bacterium]|nr:hypothetical protein [Ignavibacteriales bacterium]